MALSSACASTDFAAEVLSNKSASCRRCSCPFPWKKEWIIGTTEPAAASRFSTSVSPMRSASERSDAVTIRRTAGPRESDWLTSPHTSESRSLQPHDCRRQRHATKQKAADDIRGPMDAEIQPVESHNCNDDGRERTCQSLSPSRWGQSKDHEGKQPVDEDRPKGVAAGIGVGYGVGPTLDQHCEAGAVAVGEFERPWVLHESFVDDLRERGQRQRQQGPGLRPEATPEQVEGQTHR